MLIVRVRGNQLEFSPINSPNANGVDLHPQVPESKSCFSQVPSVGPTICRERGGEGRVDTKVTQWYT